MTIEKQVNILDYALSSLWRRRLKNVSVMLVFAAVIFLLASFHLITRALTQTAASVLDMSPDITIQKLTAGRQESIPLAYQNRISEIFGVKKIAPRIWGYYFDETHGANYTVLGIDPDSMPMGSKLSESLADGEFIATGKPGSVVTSQAVMDTLQLDDRKTLSFFRPDLSLKSFQIIGRFNDRTDILTHDLMVMNIDDARNLFSLDENLATDLCVYVGNPSELTTIAKKIADILPDTRVLTRLQIQKTYQVVFGWRSGFASICLLTALAAFTILAWDKASGLSPEERREIAILKILGWETSDILAVRFWEGLLVSTLAFLFGFTLAYIQVIYFEAALFRPVLVGWSVIAPPFRLVPDIEFADYLLMFTLTVMPYMAATVIPAWRAAIVPPDAAIN